jgi:hypothetical protein
MGSLNHKGVVATNLSMTCTNVSERNTVNNNNTVIDVLLNCFKLENNWTLNFDVFSLPSKKELNNKIVLIRAIIISCSENLCSVEISIDQ